MSQTITPELELVVVKASYHYQGPFWSTSSECDCSPLWVAAGARSYPRCFNARFSNQITTGGRGQNWNDLNRCDDQLRHVLFYWWRVHAAGNTRRYKAKHQRALLTPNFLIQLKARSRYRGGACISHVGHVPRRNCFYWRFHALDESCDSIKITWSVSVLNSDHDDDTADSFTRLR